MNPSRILIVEDEAIVSLEMIERLTAMGYEVVGAASNGERALGLVSEHQPNLVLMDIRLQGGMDGITVAEEIRRRFQLPVIFLTAYSEDATLERAKLAKPYGYILKPFNDRELKSAIEIALYRHRTDNEILRLNRLYEVLSQVSQTIVHTTSRDELLQAVCRIVGERGAIDLAWIICLDAASSHIDFESPRGELGERLKEAWCSADGRTGAWASDLYRSLQEGKPFICHECGSEKCPHALRETLCELGVRSCGSFPLFFQGNLWGALNICVSGSGYLGASEIDLLKDVSMEVSFALDKIEGEALRAQAEQALRKSEERYRLLVETSNEGIWVVDNDQVTTYVNQAMAGMLGYGPAEIMGRKVEDFLSPEDLLLHQERVNRRHAGEDEVYEQCLKRRDGSPLWTLVSAKALQDSRGCFMGSFTMSTDITERKRAEEALRNKEGLLQGILDATKESIWLFDPDFFVLSANETALKRFDMSAEEVIGKQMDHLLPEELGQSRRAHLRKVVESAQPIEFEDERNEILFRHSYYPIVDSDGRVASVVSFSRDITEQKRSEKRIREVSRVQSALHDPGSLSEKLKRITDGVVEIFSADFARIWLMGPGDLCEAGCMHAGVMQGIHACRHHEQCLHLVASSGRYTHLDGEAHRRVPFGCYKIGRIASGEEPSFLTNQVAEDQRVHNHEWAKALGLVSFAGYQLRSPHGEIFGVLALFSKHPISPEEDALLKTFSNLIVPVIQTSRAEAALREREQLMRLFITHAPAAMAMLDRDMRYLSVSHRWLTDYRLGERELVGLSHYDVFPEISENLKAVHRRALSGEVVQAENDRFERADGSVQWLRWEVRPWFDQAGDIAGIMILSEDITERKQAEEEVIRLHRHNQLVLDAADEGIVGLDEDGKIVFANPAAREMLGYETQELIGSYLHDLCHHHKQDGSPYPVTECPTHVTLTDGISTRIRDEVLWRKNGSSFPSAYSSTPILEGGKVTGAVVTFRDITARKQALDSLQESEARYRNIFENAVEGIFQTTPGGKFISVNPVFARMCGFPHPEEMVSTITEIGPQLYANPEDRLRFLASYGREGVVKRFETQFRRTDGGLFWVSISARAVRDEHGGIVCYEGTVEDITERKRLEEERSRIEAQLRQAQKVEALGTLAGGIAHDFNNILGVILGYCEMAELNAEDPLRVRKDLHEVLKAAGRARDLVRQILAFSRQSEQEKRPVQIGLIVSEALKMLRASLPSTIQIRPDVFSKAAVMADPTQIHQVLMNLCTNAAQAMEGRVGTLRVSLTDILFEPAAVLPHLELKTGPYVELTVKDTGSGIEASILDRIFDPFFTTKAQGVGTGLGLSVVHGIVRSHGGAITVQSVPGEGTTFHVFFPAIQANSKLPDVVQAASPRGWERVLVVDDEPALAKITQVMLERLGYWVEFRTSGVDALEAIRHQGDEKRFDLVITDLTMPHITGTDLAQEIHRIHPHLPVILCTGFSDKIDAARAKSLGLQGFLLKPVISDDLAKLVRKVLDEKD